MFNYDKDLNKMSALQFPMQKIFELNAATLKNFSYMHPSELTKIKRPEEIIEKSVELFVDNGHKSLDYMYNLFNILESHWFDVADTVKNNTADAMNRAESSFKNKVQHSMNMAEQVAHSTRAKSSQKTNAASKSNVSEKAKNSPKKASNSKLSAVQTQAKSSAVNKPHLHSQTASKNSNTQSMTKDK